MKSNKFYTMRANRRIYRAQSRTGRNWNPFRTLYLRVDSIQRYIRFLKAKDAAGML